MKYLILIGDGMADEILPELDNKTPLEVAHTPHMDYLAKNGLCGLVRTVPIGMKPGSDVAALTILGYDVKANYTGRAPLEAAAEDIALAPEDVAYRCNLVTLDDNIMDDYSAGHITTHEAGKIIDTLNEQLGTPAIRFYKGVSYRHLLVIKNGPVNIETTPPHDLTGEVVTGDGPEGTGSELLVELTDKSVAILADHPVNKKRIKDGKKPATTIWLWGQGKKPELENFYNKMGKTGTIITAVNLLKGIGKIVGLDVPDVPGATGYLDTDYGQKVAYAEKALKTQDFAYVHIEAPDETSHAGDLKLKIKAIEDFDAQVVGPLTKIIKKYKDYRILLMPDHATPIVTKTHSPHPVLFTICGSDIKKLDKVSAFNEVAMVNSELRIEDGHMLIRRLFNV